MPGVRRRSAWFARLRLCTWLTIGMCNQAMAVAPDFEACSIGGGTATVTANCTTLQLPIDPTKPSGEEIGVFVAYLPALASDPEPDPVLLLAGGPGQAGSEAFPAVIRAFRKLQRHRDLIIVDQRGSGRSAPLDCPASETTTLIRIEPAEVRRSSQACHDAQQSDTRQFTTSVFVQDLEWIREHLDIRRWNMYGVSYGTRVALHYLRRHPERVRSLMLDSVVPPDTALGPDIALHAQQALDSILSRCAVDTACQRAFPHIGDKLHSLLASLEASPRQVQFEDLATGRQRNLLFTREHLAATLRLMTYSAYGAAILPSMLHEAIERDNFSHLARQALLQIGQLEDSLASGLNSAVVCTEDAPWFDRADAHNAIATTYLGNDLIDALKAGCEAWPRGVMDKDFKEPVLSDTPALILSGGADPVTPPAYGDKVLETLTRARHIVLEDQGHMQAPLGCVPALMAQFVTLANAESLDTDCLQRLRPPPFFIDANGAGP